MKYCIEDGHNHFKNIPLFRVVGEDNEHVGEWAEEKAEAQKELKSLQVSFENHEELPLPVQRILMTLEEQISSDEYDVFIQILEKRGYTAEYSMCGGVIGLQELMDADPQIYLEVYPMKTVEGGDSTLYDSNDEQEIEFYDVILRTDLLNHIYYELENIKPRRLDHVIASVCKRFMCEFEIIDG